MKKWILENGQIIKPLAIFISVALASPAAARDYQVAVTGDNANDAEVEISVRQSVFYPSPPGINYLTVRGFELRQAATPWAGAMSEQIGLIGTHWSKGWSKDKIGSHIVRQLRLWQSVHRRGEAAPIRPGPGSQDGIQFQVANHQGRKAGIQGLAEAVVQQSQAR